MFIILSSKKEKRRCKNLRPLTTSKQASAKNHRFSKLGHVRKSTFIFSSLTVHPPGSWTLVADEPAVRRSLVEAATAGEVGSHLVGSQEDRPRTQGRPQQMTRYFQCQTNEQTHEPAVDEAPSHGCCIPRSGLPNPKRLRPHLQRRPRPPPRH